MKTGMFCSVNRFISSSSPNGIIKKHRRLCIITAVVVLGTAVLPSCNTKYCRWVDTGTKRGKRTMEYVCGDRLKRMERTRQVNNNAHTRRVEQNADFSNKLALARPSADQQVFINLMRAEQMEKDRMKGQTSAAQEAMAKRIIAKYKNRRISFRQVCCVNVARQLGSSTLYTAVFYVPDPNAGGGCTGRPADPSFNFYGVPFVVKRNLPASAVSRYQRGRAYSVSGRLVVNENSFSTNYEDDYYLVILGTPYENGDWDANSYPEGGRSRSGPDYRYRNDVRNSYYGEFFNMSKIVTLD